MIKNRKIIASVLALAMTASCISIGAVSAIDTQTSTYASENQYEELTLVVGDGVYNPETNTATVPIYLYNNVANNQGISFQFQADGYTAAVYFRKKRKNSKKLFGEAVRIRLHRKKDSAG